MRKIIVALTFLLACTMPVICMAESKEPQKVVTIDGFRGCKWGCSGDEIKNAEKGSAFIEYTKDYSGQKWNAIVINGADVGGYSATAVYLLADGKLEAGGYGKFNAENKQNTTDALLNKYKAVYEEPTSTGQGSDGKSALWLDENQNFILLFGLPGIVYYKANSNAIKPFFDIASIGEKYGIKLEDVS